MQTSPAGRKFIEGFEGLFLQAYDDANERIVQRGKKALLVSKEPLLAVAASGGPVS